MKNFILGAIIILLIGSCAFNFYQYQLIEEQNIIISSLEEDWFGDGVEDAADYNDYDEEYYYEENQYVELDEEFYRTIDVYEDHSIPALLPEFLNHVLSLEDYENPDSYYNYENFYNLKSSFYDYATYYNWYFDYPEYLDSETVEGEAEGFFWSDYLRSFDRSSTNIESLFDKHKNLLYTLISEEVYYGADLNDYVDILIAVQDDLDNKNSENLYEELYESEDEYFWTDNFESVIDPSLVSEWYRYDDEYYEENEVFWIYSFWYRRWIEGNQRVVYNCLKDVQAHYD